MKGTTGYHPAPRSPRTSADDDDGDEERKALIPPAYDEEAPFAPPSPLSPLPPPNRRRTGAACAALFVAVLLLTAALPYRGLFLEDCDTRARRLMRERGGLRSNGTHEFARTAVIVSIDGLR